MNLKDIKGDNFRKYYGGTMMVGIVSDTFNQASNEILKDVICINERYYNYTGKLKYHKTIDKLYEDIKECKDNNEHKVIIVSNMNHFMEDMNLEEKNIFVKNLYNMIEGTDIVLYMIFYSGEIFTHNVILDHEKLTSVVGTDDILMYSSYIANVIPLYFDSYDNLKFKYNVIKNTPELSYYYDINNIK